MNRKSLTVYIVLIIFVLLACIYSFKSFGWYSGKDQDSWYPTPIPTINCGKIIDFYYSGCPSLTTTPTPSVIVTPTASPSATPAPVITPASTNSGGGNSPTFQGSTTNAPGSPTCTIAFSSPVLTSIVAGQSGQLTLNWLESDQNIDKFSIIFGLVGQSLNMGLDNLPSNSRSYTINGLPSGSSINAQIWSWKNRCAEKSNILDPKVE